MAFFYLQENDQIQATGKDLKVKTGKGIQEILYFPKIQKDLEDKPEDHIQEVWVLEDKRFDLFLTESKKYDEAAAQLAEAQKEGNPEEIKAAQDSMRKVLNEGLGKKEDDSVDPIPQGSYGGLIECIGWVNKRTYYITHHDLKRVQDEKGKKNFRFVAGTMKRVSQGLYETFHAMASDNEEGKADNHLENEFWKLQADIKAEWKFGETKTDGQVNVSKVKRLVPNPIVQEFILSDKNCELIDSAVKFFNDTANFSINQKEQKRKQILELLAMKDGEFSHYHWGQVLIGVQEIWGKTNPDLKEEIRFDLEFEVPLKKTQRKIVEERIKKEELPPVTWDASGGAQLMRYSANVGGSVAFDFTNFNVNANYTAEAKFSLLEAGAEVNKYLPHNKGFEMNFDIPVRKEKLTPNRVDTDTDAIQGNANFAHDSFFVLPGAIVSTTQKLEALFFQNKAVSDIEGTIVKVIGHTDATGGARYNQTLGALRARATFEVFANNYAAWYGYFKEGQQSGWSTVEEDFMYLSIWLANNDPSFFRTELIDKPVGNDEKMIDILKRLYTPIVLSPFPHDKIKTTELIELREGFLMDMDRTGIKRTIIGQNPVWLDVFDAERLEYKFEFKSLVARYFHTMTEYALRQTQSVRKRYLDVFYHDCVSLPYMSKGESSLLDKTQKKSSANRRIELEAYQLYRDTYIEQEPLKLGRGRVKLTGMVSCFVGATLNASAALDITTCKGTVQATGKKNKEDKAVKYNGSEVQPDEDGKNNATAKAEAFVGAKAEAGIVMAVEWQKPEAGADFGLLGSVGGSVTGTAGAGIEGEFKIGFDQETNTFQIKCKAQATWGFGCGGAICGTIGVNQLWEFVKLTYTELQKHDFNFIDIFENVTDSQNNETESKEDVYKIYNSWIVEQFMQGNVIQAGIGANALLAFYILDDISDLFKKWEKQEREKKELEEMITAMDKNPEIIKYLPPETKGRLLFFMGQYKSISIRDLTSFDLFSVAENAAKKLIIKGIVSARDWQETLEHMAIKTKSGDYIVYNRSKIPGNENAAQKALRAKDSLVYLRNELLDEPEDWNEVEQHLKSKNIY